MNIDSVFISINATDFDGLSEWWTKLLGRKWDRQPMPSCHEWDMAGCVFFQVIDNPQHDDNTTITLHVSNLDAEIDRLQKLNIDVPAPTHIEGFDTLRFSQFSDPEGNTVGLLDGA